MDDLLQHIFEYRRLLARRDLMGGRLSAKSEARLLGLERLFGQEPTERRSAFRRRHARCEVRVPATIKASNRVLAVDVVSLGGGGLRIEPAPLLEPGDRAVVRIVSLETGTIYFYPVSVGWIQRGARLSTMGMPFVGAPRQAPLAA